ncbi:MAG: cytochrome P450 [Dehalococcoidia bacterium]|nr:cytochrome P450 [Dehalococcoidia bacterium]
MVTEQVQFNPLAPGMLADPYPTYKALRDSRPVSWSPVMDAWILTRFADVDFVLTDPRFSADRRVARNRFAEMVRQRQQELGPFAQAQTMLSSDPPEHTRLRRLVSKAFTPRAVEDLRPRIQALVDHLLDLVQEQGETDIVLDLAYPLPVIVIAEMLGVPPADRDKFKHWSTMVVATLGGPFAAPGVLEKGRQAIEELAGYFAGIIQERRQSPQNDLISGLIAAEEQGQVLSEEEIFATAILLLVAGNETTTNLIGGSVITLLNHPEQLQALREEPGLIQPAVEELLRFSGPVHATGRVLKEDLEVGGQPMEAGQVAFCLLAAANRDPEKYADPERFDVRRNPADHLAFGDGTHFCLGAPLARAEAQIALGTLLRRFPRLALRAEPEWGGTFIIRGPKQVLLDVGK